MLKLTFLGTCSGTEPMPGRHHASFVIEKDGRYYWFDAGENCSYVAHTSGIDVTRIRAVFISHMHIDHIGGLANLLSVIRKVERVSGVPHINGNSYDIFLPDLEKFASVKDVAGVPSAPCRGVNAIEHEVRDGLIFEDESIRVSALHNTHLKENGEWGWHSFSYLIESGQTRIVYSGDVGYPAELDPLVCGGCDALIIETGHHSVDSICEYAVSRGVPRLLFTHHGREILADVEAAAEKVGRLHPDAVICNDGDDFFF